MISIDYTLKLCGMTRYRRDNGLTLVEASDSSVLRVYHHILKDFNPTEQKALNCLMKGLPKREVAKFTEYSLEELNKLVEIVTRKMYEYITSGRVRGCKVLDPMPLISNRTYNIIRRAGYSSSEDLINAYRSSNNKLPEMRGVIAGGVVEKEILEKVICVSADLKVKEPNVIFSDYGVVIYNEDTYNFVGRSKPWVADINKAKVFKRELELRKTLDTLGSKELNLVVKSVGLHIIK